MRSQVNAPLSSKQKPMLQKVLIYLTLNLCILCPLSHAETSPMSTSKQPVGIEADPSSAEQSLPQKEGKNDQSIQIRSPHLRLTQVILHDATDHNNELVQEKHWLLYPRQGKLELSGNLFLVEDPVKQTGILWIKEAPLPHARPTKSKYDLKVSPLGSAGYSFTLKEDATGPTWTTIKYTGGALERAKALQEWQQAQRPTTTGHQTVRFLSNTWGDRSRDGRMREDFILSEIDAAATLGVDVLQLDDGWQKGTTANSKDAAKNGGVWEGFWKTDPDFWTVHPERFPNGLEGVLDYAKSQGIQIGLWYAPDSWNDFANWRLDADRILELHNQYGVDHFKVDSINFKSEIGRQHLHALFDRVLEGSSGQVIFDLDITAGTRPGYFGAIDVGPLFVENRYTDWRNYWPHHTLRNLWKLSHWIAPQRLRMEFLNNQRNADKYGNDPLAPAQYPADTLFASVMFSNPLGWFECSGLPEDYIATAAPLIETWKAHREALFQGTILPIGNEPNGIVPTGFLSVSDDRKSGYLLAFRELAPDSRISMPVPEGLDFQDIEWEVLYSDGEVDTENGFFSIQIPNKLGFVFARFSSH